MPQLADYLTVAALFPALVTFASNTFTIYNLWGSNMSRARSLSLFIYIIVTVVLSGGLLLHGAQQVFDGRKQEQREVKLEKKVDTIRAVLGSAPGTSGEEVLNRIIAKFSQPREITKPQIAKMAHDVAFLKSDLPHNVAIYRSNVSAQTAEDYNLYNPLYEIFSRNGFSTTIGSYISSSVDESGLMIVVKDPLQPPEPIRKLIEAFDLSGIIHIRLVKNEKLYSDNTLSFMIGPSPI